MITIPACPGCGNTRVHARGSKGRPGRFHCRQCSLHFTDKGDPNVLVFDIETLPIIGTFWQPGQQYVSAKNILEDWVVLSWSAKRLFSNEVVGDILRPGELQARLATVIQKNPSPHNADERIVRALWKLLDEADAVITQNGKKFDVRKMNARFIHYGLPPYRPFHHIDTLEAARAAFGTSSRSLDYMTKFLSLERKLETEYDLWLGCMYGDRKSLKEMYDYGINDTHILEDYYSKIRAWIPKHPNFSAYTHKYVDVLAGEVACPVCRSVVAESKRDEFVYTTPIGNHYEMFRCGHCGAHGRKSKKVPGTAAVRGIR